MDAVSAETRTALHDVFGRWARASRAPGVAWGVVRAGELVARGGVGSLRLDAREEPETDSVFRIASMTKSFTGAALMTLVVDGRLRLDDPVSMYAPELAGWRGPTADGPPLTLRHLVSMESGLPTDDAWADRHLDLSSDAMTALIEAGATFALTPGVRFEYSNLGWGLLGRVVERVAGMRVQDLVTSSLLEPLGMSSTSWSPPARGAVAMGHRVRDGNVEPEDAPLGDGAIAPMGGLWSTVRDLATWVGFLADGFPPRDGADDGPLPRWARREMQQLRRLDHVTRTRPAPAGPSRVVATGYGIGLGIRVDERLGTSVGHSGGLPGFGSHMRWLPSHGIGVIGLSNVTYGDMHGACVEALEVLADRDELGPQLLGPPTSLLGDAASRAAALLSAWDEGSADDLFADNVVLDEPFARRAAEAGAIVARSGRLGVDSIEHETPMRGAFVTARGEVRVELGLNHEGRTQWLDVEDRLRPSDAPVVVTVPDDVLGTAVVVVRPVGGLADAFDRWQGDVLDRMAGAVAIVPAAHATLRVLGSTDAPLTSDDEERARRVVSAWADRCRPIELRAVALEPLERGHVLAVGLAPSDSFVTARADLGRRCEAGGFPSRSVEEADADAPHLSLAYSRDVDPGVWTLLTAWASTISVGDLACTAFEAELLAYDAGGERRLGAFRLAGSTA